MGRVFLGKFYIYIGIYNIISVWIWYESWVDVVGFSFWFEGLCCSNGERANNGL